MIKNIYLHYMLIACCFIISCKNKKQENIKIIYFPNGSIKSFEFANSNQSNNYKIKFNENGDIDSLRQTNIDSTTTKFSFFKNGCIKSYSKSKNSIFQNSIIEFDSLSNISELYLTTKPKNKYFLNQMLVFNEHGIISSKQSYYLQIQEWIVDKNMMEMEINLIGPKSKNCYAVIGNFDENFELLQPNKSDTIYGISNKMIAKIRINKGTNIVRGIVHDFKAIDEGVEEGRMIYFSKVLYY